MTFAGRNSKGDRRFSRRGAHAFGGVATIAPPWLRADGPEDRAEARTERVEHVRERVLSGEYEVDPAAVAEAIVQRLSEGGALGGRE